MQTSEIAGVVVLYNPDDLVMDNINTYINQIGKLFIIDNSEKKNVKLIEEINSWKNIKYISHNCNKGIAAAFNLGAKEAIDEGFKYLLTMDQDSKATDGMISKLLYIMNNNSDLGLVAADHINPSFLIETNKISKEVLYTMASGNLVKLKAFQAVGGFLENLFIDHVDHEFCLRLNANGFKVIKTGDAVIIHRPGKTVKKKFLFVNLYPSYHSPIRLYYRTRNRLYVDQLYKKKFPEYVKEDRKNMLFELAGMLLYEQNLYQKIKMISLGFIHFRRNILGKYENNIGN